MTVFSHSRNPSGPALLPFPSSPHLYLGALPSALALSIAKGSLSLGPAKPRHSSDHRPSAGRLCDCASSSRSNGHLIRKSVVLPATASSFPYTHPSFVRSYVHPRALTYFSDKLTGPDGRRKRARDRGRVGVSTRRANKIFADRLM